MEEYASMFLQGSITVLVGIITFLITLVVERFYIAPYYDFKKELISIRINLLFYNNILTNFFERGEINDKFFDKIMTAQEKMREHWAKISTKYYNTNKNLFRILKKIPSKDEMKKIEECLIYLQNSRIVHLKRMPDNDNCLERNEKLNKTLEIINKYI